MGIAGPHTTWNVGPLRTRANPYAPPTRLSDQLVDLRLESFGARGDGEDTGTEFTGTDNWQAFVDLVEFMAEHEGRYRVCVNPGYYRIGDPTTAVGQNYISLTGLSTFILYGEDPANTFFLLDEDYDYRIAQNRGGSFFLATANAVSPFNRETHNIAHIEGVSFKGRWTHYPGGDGNDPNHVGPCPFEFEGFKRVVIRNCGFFDIRNKAMRCAHNESFHVRDCYGERMARGFARSVDTQNVVCTGNTIKHADDDVIDFNITTDVSLNPPIGVVVSNNTFVDCESALCSQGRGVIFSNNVFIRSKGAAVGIVRSGGASPLSGRVAHWGNIIDGNVIVDNLSRYDFTTDEFGEEDDPEGIQDVLSSRGSLSIVGNRPSAVTTAVAPGKYDTDAGEFVLPWETDAYTPSAGYMHGVNTSAYSIPPGYGYTVANNQIIRTLPAVAQYDDWGMGQMFTRQGWKNPVVPDTAWRPNGIQVAFDLENVIIIGNVVQNLRAAGIVVDGGRSDFPEKCFQNIKITQNLIRRVENGVRLIGALDDTTGEPLPVTSHWSIDIEGNQFDIDPYHELVNRFRSGSPNFPDGSWDLTPNGTRTGDGVFIYQIHGVKVHNNTFMNCYKPVGDGLNDEPVGVDLFNNLLRCDPADVGYDAANKGIGYVPRAGSAFHYMIVNSDPNDDVSGDEYLDTINICPRQASAIPTTGKFVAGHEVVIDPPVTANGRTLIRARRLTTGSDHGASDWLAEYSIVPEFGTTWTPALTAATPGDLAVTYSQQTGSYTRIGDLYICNFRITTSAFTHATASGALRLTGLPVTTANNNDTPRCAVTFQGVTKANYTQIVSVPTANNTIATFECSGSGQTVSILAITDLPSGGNVVLRGTIMFRA